MEQKPYYEQSYQEPGKPRVPNSGFGQIFKEFFTKPFTWNARDTRKTFWLSYVIYCVCSLILGILSVVSFIPSETRVNAHVIELNGTNAITNILIFIIGLAWIYLSLCLIGTSVRRLHDSDHTGWWWWIQLVPFGWLVWLYFMVVPTVEEPVRWGSYLSIKE
ncbi:DUF805 domain-containing protein [Lactobacillus sp. PV037]|uniref:DUF805 domain-containing protein n=1 Tax=unclassified Lactobacillus TaxID=2620435 RepID=UPI00223EBEB5|nr:MULTISPECIES: DUF805 domain-containing protein [unclassified Lactobacillus]QNQ81973.1 DUF805 domain-containing protein [Lactobacillus sp. PV012]QNQ83992.1 DUF805 domain-containing protein [Lactobacillus sp. PV037]